MALRDWLRTVLDAPRATRAALSASAVTVDPTLPPFDGVVQIEDQISGKYYVGSGVLLTPTEVLTASHVLYTTGDAPATGITVTSGSSSVLAGHTVPALNIHYNLVDDANGMITLSASQQDYAIIHLAQPLYSPADFQLLANFAAGTTTTSGYPVSANDDQVDSVGPTAVYAGLSLLFGPALGPGSSGGPVWITGSSGQPQVVGVISSYDPTMPNTGNDAQITTAAYNQIESWIAQDGGNTPPLTVLDTSQNENVTAHVQDYTGPVSGLVGQYINISSDNLNLTAGAPNLFLHSGSGEDALQALGGTNVLDGGTGSNFLVGGTGTDTFFTDNRAATSDIWDTLVHFHAGDAATLFGVTQADFTFSWVNNEGAAGYQGLTLHATAPGRAEASITLAGLTTSALTDGQLTLDFGTTNGSSYLYIYANH